MNAGYSLLGTGPTVGDNCNGNSNDNVYSTVIKVQLLSVVRYLSAEQILVQERFCLAAPLPDANQCE